MITLFFSLLKSDDSLLLLYITTYCRTALLCKKKYFEKIYWKNFCYIYGTKVLRYAIHFFFGMRKSSYFGGVPCVFLRSGLVPGLVLGLGPELSEPGYPGSCAGFGLFPGLVLVLVRAPCRAVIRA